MSKSNRFLHSAVSSRCDRILQGNSTPKIPSYSYRGKEDQLPSHQTTGQFVATKDTKVYTGTAMLGIATMHKSSAVPVFSQQEAIEISKMRRG